MKFVILMPFSDEFHIFCMVLCQNLQFSPSPSSKFVFFMVVWRNSHFFMQLINLHFFMQLIVKISGVFYLFSLTLSFFVAIRKNSLFFFKDFSTKFSFLFFLQCFDGICTYFFLLWCFDEILHFLCCPF